MGRFFWCVSNALIHWCFRRRHVPTLRCDLRASLIVAGMNHRILSRLTRIQRDDYSWEFVADYLEHGLHGLYGYVGFVESC